MPSGKQVLLNLIRNYSQKSHDESDLEKVTENIQSALCAHCSTSSERMKEIIQVGWLSESEDGELVRQGMGLLKSSVFLSDLFEEAVNFEEIPSRISNRFPKMSKDEYASGLSIIWHLLSSLQYWDQLSSVENHGELEANEADSLIECCKRWLKSFENDPW